MQPKCETQKKQKSQISVNQIKVPAEVSEFLPSNSVSQNKK